MKAKMSRVAALLIANAAAAAVLLLAAEGAVRLFGGSDQPYLFEDRELRTRGTRYVEPHPDRGFALKAGFRSHKVNINSFGFRGEEPSPGRDDRFTILFLGESTVFGWRVRDDLSIPSLTAGALREEGHEGISVINAGVPSYSSSQVLIYLRELLERPDISPDLVLVGAMWNDLWYSGTLNWYPELLVYQQPSRWRSFLVRHSALYRKAALGRAAGERSTDYFNEKAYRHYRANLSAMAQECSRRGIPLLFLEPPYSPDQIPADGVGLLQVWFGKPFLDKLVKRYAGALAEESPSGPGGVVRHPLGPGGGGESSLFMDFSHPLPEGNGKIAAAVVRHLREGYYLPDGTSP